jgi:hypothetical protein
MNKKIMLAKRWMNAKYKRKLTKYSELSQESLTGKSEQDFAQQGRCHMPMVANLVHCALRCR